MDEQAYFSVPSPNNRQMNAKDLQILIKNQKSYQNISDATHISHFYISQPLNDVSFKKNLTQCKQHQKITSIVSHPQNYSYAFINQNIAAPLNIYSNSVLGDSSSKQDKILPESDDQQFEQPSKNADYEFQSDKLQKYFDFMKQNFKQSNVYKNEFFSKQKFQKQFFPLVQQLQKTIEQNSIVKLKNQKIFTQVLIKNVTQYGNYQIVDLDICLGKYEKNVKIYHLIEDSCFHTKQLLDQGTFGSIFQGKFMGTEFIVKCVSKTIKHDYKHFHNLKQKPAFFKEILKEYIIAYIAGVLEIGPKVLSPFGFDLVISKKCIQFFMQKCTPPNDLEDIHDKLQELKKSLFHLHLLNIVHNDIKPQNIMFKKTTGKLLFIDFGLSEYTQKPIGHKKQTKFIGTYQYASPQMQKLLFQNESGMIDLYYNDAYGLNLAINKLFQTQIKAGNGKEYSLPGVTSKQTQNILNIIFLKFVIWKQRVDEAITLSNIIGLKNLFQLQKSILEFILKIRHPQRLRYFYHQSFHQTVKQNQKFKRLKEAYVRNISFGEIEILQKNQDYKDFRNLYQHLQNMQHQISEKQTSFKQRSIAKLEKKQLLLGKYQKLSDQKLWSLYLDFVNFLKRNEIVQIQEKYEVSLFMIKRFEIKQDFVNHRMFGNDEYLPSIAQCLYFLLKECLAPQSKYFLPNRVPKLLSLLILLGWHIPDQYLVEWRQILSLSFEDLNQKIISYLDFQIIQQISFNRFFKFKNQKCLNHIDFLIRIRKQQTQGQKLQKKSFYDNLIDERKRQNINLQTQLLLNIVISMLQLNQISKNIKEQNLDQLVNDIEQLPHNIFKNKNNYLWVKSQLLFWVDLKFSVIRIDQEKQLRLLEKIKSLKRLPYHHLEVLIYHFQIISLYHNLKNFNHLKIQLEYFDRTINYNPVNQNMCVPRRLMLSYMLKDLNQFGKIIGKIQKIKIQNFYDIDILRHTAYLYQNVYAYSLGKNTQDEYTELLSFRIQSLMKQFAINFDRNLSLKLKKNNRLCFAQFVRAIFAIGFQYCLKNENPYSIFSTDNLKLILKVLQNLSFQFSDNEIITTYITQKMGFLLAQGKYSEACQFLQNQSHIKFSDLNLSNYRQASILINYYLLKINLGNDERAIYIRNMKKIYNEMVAKESYSSIFNNRKLFYVILNNVQNFQEAFKYFKVMTEHLSHHPSKQNVEILISYLNDFMMMMINKPVGQTQENHQTSKDRDYSRQKNNQQKNFVEQFYDYLRDEINFKRLWQNPYMILVLYVTSTFCKKFSYEVIKVFKIICHNMKYLNNYAKSFILKNYYELVNIKIQAKSYSKRKHIYLLKKHFKVTSQTFQFQSILNVRSNKQNLLNVVYFQFPGQSNMRKKIYHYYNNLQILNKNNYFDSFSTFSSEKSLSDSFS